MLSNTGHLLSSLRLIVIISRDQRPLIGGGMCYTECHSRSVVKVRDAMGEWGAQPPAPI